MARVSTLAHRAQAHDAVGGVRQHRRRANERAVPPHASVADADRGATAPQTPPVRAPGYDRRMRSLPTVLLILSLPAGAIAYVVATWMLSSLDLPTGFQEFLILIAPLFVAGLVMVPFLIPFFDRKAKADLAEHRRAMASVAEDHDLLPDGATRAPGETVHVVSSDPSDSDDPTAPR
jgi:hypothetical protein